MQVQFDTKISKLKIKYTHQKKIIFGLFWVLDLIQQILSKQDWFLGCISEFSGGSRLGAEMSGTGILFKPKHDCQNYCCEESQIILLLDCKLCNHKKVKQLYKEKNINAVQIHVHK